LFLLGANQCVFWIPFFWSVCGRGTPFFNYGRGGGNNPRFRVFLLFFFFGGPFLFFTQVGCVVSFLFFFFFGPAWAGAWSFSPPPKTWFLLGLGKFCFTPKPNVFFLCLGGLWVPPPVEKVRIVTPLAFTSFCGGGVPFVLGDGSGWGWPFGFCVLFRGNFPLFFVGLGEGGFGGIVWMVFLGVCAFFFL